MCVCGGGGGGGGIKMTSEFIHEENSIMDYNGLSWTIMGGVIMDYH